MIRVNLLPPEILLDRERRRRRARVMLAGTLLVVLLAGSWGLLFRATRLAEARAIALREERAKVEAEIAIYAPYAQLQAEVTQKISRIKKAMGTVPDWVQVLGALGRAIPGDVWLTDCVATSAPNRAEGASPPEPPAGQTPGQPPSGQAPQGQPAAAPAAVGQIVLRGLTYDQPSTAHWLAQLYELPELTDVRCVFSGVENYQGTELIRFEVKAVLRPGPQYDPLKGSVK